MHMKSRATCGWIGWMGRVGGVGVRQTVIEVGPQKSSGDRKSKYVCTTEASPHVCVDGQGRHKDTPSLRDNSKWFFVELMSGQL